MKELLRAVFGRDDDTARLSRRNVLAGLGLVGAAAAATQLVPSAAEAMPLEMPVGHDGRLEANADGEKLTQQASAETNAAEAGDATDLSSQWYWRRRRRRVYVVRRRYFVVRRRWRRRRYW